MQTDSERVQLADTRSRFSLSRLGKLPPQAVDVEEAVLGSILISQDAFIEAADVLHADAFYKDNHQKIFKACQRLFTARNPIDIITVTSELRQMGELEMVGGAYYITELTNRVSSSANIEYHCQIVMQKFLQREMIRLGVECVNSAYEDTTDVFELIEKNQSDTFSLLNSVNNKEIDDAGSLAMDFLDALDKKPENGFMGVPSGFNGIDSLTGGWRNSKLTIIAARPAMGKTAFVLENAKNASVLFGKPTLIFSLEMTSSELMERMVSSTTNILFDKIYNKTMTDEEHQIVHSKISLLANAPIFIDDSPTLNVFDFRIKARRMKQRYGIEMIIVDYLQLMTGIGGNKSGNREQEISLISRTLKSVSRELEVPVLALSQLSRAVEGRKESKRPMLSDLRESGSIEQDADQVAFLYRPEYYGINEFSNGESTAGLAELIFAKNRSGVCGTVKLDFNGAYMRFKDWKPDIFTKFSDDVAF